MSAAKSANMAGFSIWLAVIFIVANVAYFLLIPALGPEGQPSQGWVWAVVPVSDMLYIAI
jgi:hypothetical protein